ncbi:proline-rich protein 2-like [Motacilla alba alba]|uniref:proline-rich protein 2-like n=1 Tax=Motacilla alba alba TaxID=1094192 RepID=UPI0018D4DCF2|nr:proline-rich protein 2-like [Motacilla alba alba]
MFTPRLAQISTTNVGRRFARGNRVQKPETARRRPRPTPEAPFGLATSHTAALGVRPQPARAPSPPRSPSSTGPGPAQPPPALAGSRRCPRPSRGRRLGRRSPPSRGGGEKGGRRFRAAGVLPCSPAAAQAAPEVRSKPGPRTVPALQARPAPHHRAPPAGRGRAAAAGSGGHSVAGTRYLALAALPPRSAPAGARPRPAPAPPARPARHFPPPAGQELRREEPSEIKPGRVQGPASGEA